jgi:hypothetical protein
MLEVAHFGLSGRQPRRRVARHSLQSQIPASPTRFNRLARQPEIEVISRQACFPCPSGEAKTCAIYHTPAGFQLTGISPVEYRLCRYCNLTLS